MIHIFHRCPSCGGFFCIRSKKMSISNTNGYQKYKYTICKKCNTKLQWRM